MARKELKKSEVVRILKGSGFYHGPFCEKEGQDWNIQGVEIWTPSIFSSEFLIITQDPTRLLAEATAKKHGVELIHEDFSKKGQKEQKPFYSYVFAKTCNSIKEIEQARNDLQSALKEFQEKNK